MSEFVFMDFSIGEEPVGRVIFDLFEDTPLTSANFRALCTGSNPGGLHYKDSKIHRVVRNFAIQGGDITCGDGTGGASIYGERFDDENFIHNHSQPFMVSMANSGPNTNSSQFFVTLKGASHLDGKHVAFGHVIAGKSVMRAIEDLDTDSTSNQPITSVTITDCGELPRDPKVLIPFLGSQDGLTADQYEEFPDDNYNLGKEEGELNFDDAEVALKVTQEIKEFATEAYKMAADTETTEEREFVLNAALKKYKKALRYVYELSPDLDNNKKVHDQFQKLKLALHQNIGLVALQLRKYDTVVTSTSAALDMACANSRDKAKALSRRSSAYQGLKKHETALADLQKAHELLPADPQIAKSLTALEEANADKEKKQKAQYAKFFG